MLSSTPTTTTQKSEEYQNHLQKLEKEKCTWLSEGLVSTAKAIISPKTRAKNWNDFFYRYNCEQDSFFIYFSEDSICSTEGIAEYVTCGKNKFGKLVYLEFSNATKCMAGHMLDFPRRVCGKPPLKLRSYVEGRSILLKFIGGELNQGEPLVDYWITLYKNTKGQYISVIIDEAAYIISKHARTE